METAKQIECQQRAHTVITSINDLLDTGGAAELVEMGGAEVLHKLRREIAGDERKQDGKQ